MVTNAFQFDPNVRKEIETRLFLLNGCSHRCFNCFYTKKNHNFSDFKKAIWFAQTMANYGYHHETLYLLPTDYMDEQHKEVFLDDADFQRLTTYYNSVGIATTFLTDFDLSMFERLKMLRNRIDIFVNLDYNFFDDPTYYPLIQERVSKVRDMFGDGKSIINCAVNLGIKLQPQWIPMIKKFRDLSTDKNVEINFTYLSNEKIPMTRKTKFLEQSLSDLNILRTEVYENLCMSENVFNKITLVFQNDQVYFSPMVPYDEALNIMDNKYAVETPEDIFRVAQACFQEPLPDECAVCDELPYCLTKGYISARNTMNVGCYKTY